ncbi:MAG: hypothetical protein IPN86_17720 [Saprospiraceae bacterium]|nr:hypothetical protein [Saprospiraceae bacterium]
MSSKMPVFGRYASIIILIFNAIVAHAHQPDLSSLMIYEQNGKSFLAIKSALSAFESEIEYSYPKGAYKTPAEFQELVIGHFQKKSFLVINGDTIKFIHPQVSLGHETTLFAELSEIPIDIKSMHIKNTIFGDISHSICEVIITLKGKPQKQFLLTSENKHEARLKLESGTWVMVENEYPLFTKSALIFLGIFVVTIFLVAGMMILKRKNPKVSLSSQYI